MLHGIGLSTEGRIIEVAGLLDTTNGINGAVFLYIADTGVGMTETALPGISLAIVAKRLQAYYSATVHIDLHCKNHVNIPSPFIGKEYSLRARS